jgi:hypothetical protein
MSTPPREPTEEELRALEAELKRVTVQDVLAQTAVSLVNLAGRRLGIAEGTTDERDLEQARDGIDAVQALLPLLERGGAPEVPPLRDALARLKLAYAREHAAGPQEPSPGEAAASQPAGPAPPQPGGAAAGKGATQGKPRDQRRPGPAESSGRLWVPGR